MIHLASDARDDILHQIQQECSELWHESDWVYLNYTRTIFQYNTTDNPDTSIEDSTETLKYDLGESAFAGKFDCSLGLHRIMRCLATMSFIVAELWLLGQGQLFVGGMGSRFAKVSWLISTALHSAFVPYFSVDGHNVCCEVDETCSNSIPYIRDISNCLTFHHEDIGEQPVDYWKVGSMTRKSELAPFIHYAREVSMLQAKTPSRRKLRQLVAAGEGVLKPHLERHSSVFLVELRELHMWISQIRRLLQTTSENVSQIADAPMVSNAPVFAPVGSKAHQRVLYGVETCSDPTMEEIVETGLRTWAKHINRENLIVVGGKYDDANYGLEKHHKLHYCMDVIQDLYCAELVLIWRAIERARVIDADWLVVSQEDKYIWTEGLEALIAPFDPAEKTVLGLTGCGQAWKYNPDSRGGRRQMPPGWVEPLHVCEHVWQKSSYCGGLTYIVSRGMLSSLAEEGETLEQFIASSNGVFKNSTYDAEHHKQDAENDQDIECSSQQGCVRRDMVGPVDMVGEAEVDQILVGKDSGGEMSTVHEPTMVPDHLHEPPDEDDSTVPLLKSREHSELSAKAAHAKAVVDGLVAKLKGNVNAEEDQDSMDGDDQVDDVPLNSISLGHQSDVVSMCLFHSRLPDDQWR